MTWSRVTELEGIFRDGLRVEPSSVVPPRRPHRGWAGMSWVTRRGRPLVIPDDRTTLRGRSVNARTRIAWLLRVSRLANHRGGARHFTEALAEHGQRVGTTALSRYETGAEPVTLPLVRAYEKALALPAGGLVGMVYRIDKVFGPAIAPAGGRAPSRAELSAAAARFEGYFARDEMTGIRWIRVAQAMTCTDGVLIPPTAMRTVLERLVSEAMRSVGVAYVSRMHALSVMLTDPIVRPCLVETIDDLASRPGAQAVEEIISILGDSDDHDVLAWLINQFKQSSGAHQWGAAHGLITSIARTTLPADLVPRLSTAILLAAADGDERGLPAFIIAQRLSKDLTREVVRRLRRVPVSLSPGARIEGPEGLSRYRGAALRESGLDDRMLDRLLRESLSPDFVERQHFSLLMLMLSPYREVLADTALEALTGSGKPCISQSAVPCLRYLAHPGQSADLVTLLGDRDHRMTALDALAHAGGVPHDVDLVHLLDDGVDPQELVYAAGMSGHPDLTALAGAQAVVDAGAAPGAQWWLRSGPVLTEDDGTVDLGEEGTQAV